jgi:uncharacterized protein YcfL
MRLIALLLVMLVGCSSTPPAPAPVVNHDQTYPAQKLVVDKEVNEMSRQEIISAIQECQTNDLRPVPVKSKKKVDGRIIDAIIDVICAPQKTK